MKRRDEMGLFGLSIPESYGGIGLSMSQEYRVAYEIGQTALAFRSVFGSNVGIGSQGILMDGTEEQKRDYLPCTEMVGRVADRGVQVHGGSGYINEFPIERFYRDVRLLRLYEGTTQIQQLIVGRELIGRD